MAPLVYVPFMSSNERFDGQTLRSFGPGPGTYDSKKARTGDKAMRPKPSFGISEQRFRASMEEKEVGSIRSRK